MRLFITSIFVLVALTFLEADHVFVLGSPLVAAPVGLTMTIAPRDTTASDNEPVVLTVTIKNSGSQPARLLYENLDQNITFTVKDAHGVAAPPTLYALSIPKRSPTSVGSHDFHIMKVPVNGVVTLHYCLNRLVDITLPKTYTVSATGTFPSKDERGPDFQLSSNPVTVTEGGRDIVF